MVESVRPWESPDAGDWVYSDSTGRWVKSDLIPRYDSQEQIELCLTCPYADDCHDCVARGTTKKTNLLRRITQRSGKRKVRFI